MSQVITEFSKSNLPFLRSEINDALKLIGEKYGISLVAGNASFTADDATFKLNCALGAGKTNTNIRMDKMAENFTLHQFRLGNLNMTSTYVILGVQYKIVGYNPRAHQYPLILEDQKTKKRFKFDVESVQRATIK